MGAQSVDIRYGQLQRILVCELGPQRVWKDLKELTLVLALIKPAKTNGEDASVVTTSFSQFSADVITDIQSIKAVIGRVETRGWWGIIDRSTTTARTTFAADEVDEDSDNGGNSDSD